MNLVIGGCRGAYPVLDKRFNAYGGDTTSFLVQGASGDRILIDLGTGLRRLNETLLADPGSRNLLVLMTHYHLDHVAGLPALVLLHDPKWSVTFAAPKRKGRRVDAVLPRLLNPPFSPLRLEDHAAHIEWKTLAEPGSGGVFSWGSFRIRHCPLQHPGGCSAYRIEEGNRALVVATDLEWSLTRPAQRAALLALCGQEQPADLLVLDGQYSRETYPGHEGWGHSTWQECVAIAREAGVKRLVISHHAPKDDDAVLDAKADAIRGEWSRARLARAGDVYSVPAAPDSGTP